MDESFQLTQPMYSDDLHEGNSSWKPIYMVKKQKREHKSKKEKKCEEEVKKAGVEALHDLEKCLEDVEDRINSIRKRLKLRIKAVKAE